MSEINVGETSNECSNDSLLLDRVFLRLGNADTDEQLENCLNRFLPPVILKLSSPHEQIRTKVMELLVHVNKRVRCRNDVQLPVETLLQSYKVPTANSFIINFSIIYITMGFPRLPKDQQISLVPSLLEAIESKPVAHQDSILMLVMPLLGDIKEQNLNLKENPKLAKLILKFATDVLLLPYRALPNSGESDFQVPPGMSLRSYKRIVDKNQINPNQLEEMKLSIVKFLSQEVFPDGEGLLALVVAAADSRFSVANLANTPLVRAHSSVDWSQTATVAPLYSLYLGTWGGAKVAPEDRKVAACTRLRLKLIQYLNRGTGRAVVFPHCVQVVFSSLFVTNTNARLRNGAIMFLLNVINNGNEVQLRQVASVFLQGLLKLIRAEEHAEHHAKAYTCLGRLATKCPSCFNNQFALLEELVKKIPEAAPEIKTALRDALLEMADAYKIAPEGPPASPPGPSEPGASKKARPSRPPEPHALALFALLDHYMHCEEPMIRYVAVRYSAAVFPPDHAPSRYLLLLAAGDSQEEISTEALKYLYGSSRPNEIEDAVNNASGKEKEVHSIDEGAAGKDDDGSKEDEFKTPHFKDAVDYVWDQMQKRKNGSNAKHRFVIGNQVLQFHPTSYREILRYLRMCLNRDVNLKDCSDHPNASSPILTKYFYENLVDTEALDRYLTMITSLLAASPGILPLRCFLDIVGCIPERIANRYTSLLPSLKRLLTTSTNEEIRETSAAIYAIITMSTSDKSSIEREISEFVDRARNDKNLESQCGYLMAFTHLCERSIVLCKRNKFGGKGFNPSDWEPYREGVLCLATFLSHSQTLLVSTSCIAISMLVRCSALPLPNISSKQETLLNTDNPFKIDRADAIMPEDEVTKFSIVHSLFKIVANAKLPSKVKERSLYTLGLVCCGERFRFAKQIIIGFLQMAKDSKEFEIHLQIGESLVLCIEGVNSNENRDLWTELPRETEDRTKDREALKENDELLQWLLSKLFKIGKHPHPHSRQATCIWLLALLKSCPEREPIRNSLQLLQDNFMEFLSENSDIVQDVASKGLSLVYQNSDEDQKKTLVSQIIDQLTSGKRAVARVQQDTRVFEKGQLGSAPEGGNLSTYKELCSLASDLNQPDLLYKFMHLAHHNSIWNSKRGAAFGFQRVSVLAGGALAPQLPRIVPRLYRYRFDPAPRIQASMAAIWSALVANTTATVQKYHKEILNDLVVNLTSNQWRVRMSCCNALADLLRGAQSLHQSLEHLATIWTQLFRVMDDVHEGTRQAATGTANVLSKLCIRAADVNQGKDGEEVLSAILPVLLDTGITNLVKEVRSVSLQTVSSLVSSAGASLAPLLARLVPALAAAAGELEPTRLAHLSTALADGTTRDALDDLRASAAKRHYTTDTLVKCMPYVTIDIMREVLPKILELTKSPQLGTKVACAHFLVLSAHYLRGDLEPVAGKIMSALLNGIFDRNATIRKNYAETLGQISAHAKPQSIEKLMKKLIHLYEAKEDDASRSAVALTLKAVAEAKVEHLKDNEDALAPLVFLAMHHSDDGGEGVHTVLDNDNIDSRTAETFSELWSELSPVRSRGARRHLPALRAAAERALAAAAWAPRVQAANAIRTMCRDLSNDLGEEREPLVRSLLAAIRGKTFDGKYHVLEALADLCASPEGATPAPSLRAEAADALLAECRKAEARHRRHALSALARLAPTLPPDPRRFRGLYEIVERILGEDERSKNGDSDEEDDEGVRRRRGEATALKEAAYDLLGEAWPRDPDTQEKYRDLYFEHCSKSYPASSASIQLAMLSSMERVLARLALLRDEPMDTDDDAGARDAAVAGVVGHVAAVVEHTLENSNRVRHRRDALNLMETLIKRLKELHKMEELNKLREIFQAHARDLSKEESHELRARVADIKVYFE